MPGDGWSADRKLVYSKIEEHGEELKELKDDVQDVKVKVSVLGDIQKDVKQTNELVIKIGSTLPSLVTKEECMQKQLEDKAKEVQEKANWMDELMKYGKIILMIAAILGVAAAGIKSVASEDVSEIVKKEMAEQAKILKEYANGSGSGIPHSD
jgi:hypothetical protein